MGGARDSEFSLEREDVFPSGVESRVVCLAHQEAENRVDDNLLIGTTSEERWERSKRQKG